MSDITDESGVALSQPNYHYKNKEGLFMGVIDMTVVLFDFAGVALWDLAYGDKLNRFFQDIATLIEKSILLDDHLKAKVKEYSTNAIAQVLSSALFGASVQFLLNPSGMKPPNALDAIELVYE